MPFMDTCHPILDSSLYSAEKFEQNKLDISARSRTSRLPWRGQFSPDLVEYFLETVCRDSGRLLDPFCGSGTVVFESIKHNRTAFGAEINPAAWHMAALSSISKLPNSSRTQIIKRLRGAAHEIKSIDLQSIDVTFYVKEKMESSSNDYYYSMATAAVIIIAMENGTVLNSKKLERAYVSISNIISEFASTVKESDCYLTDARTIPLVNQSIDGIITSPPYINVFNYHQNYRNAVEILGWLPLEAAKSEIGANRKFRQNRFLTVVQYCLDMQESLAEMARVLELNAPLVMVLGRTSNVLGTPFRNSELIANLIACSGELEIVNVADRVFTNRFGEKIFEDIIVANKRGSNTPQQCNAREIGYQALKDGLENVPDKNRSLLMEAIDQAIEVKPSPVFNATIPHIFKNQI